MNSNGGVNRVMLAGQVVDLLSEQINSVSRCLNFTMKTTEKIYKNNMEITQEEIHHIILPETLLNKKRIMIKTHDTIFIQGRIKTSHYINEDGVKCYKTEVLAAQIEIFQP